MARLTVSSGIRRRSAEIVDRAGTTPTDCHADSRPPGNARSGPDSAPLAPAAAASAEDLHPWPHAATAPTDASGPVIRRARRSQSAGWREASRGADNVVQV